jgi:hypothetical protein
MHGQLNIKYKKPTIKAKTRETKYVISYSITQLGKNPSKIHDKPDIGKRVRIGNTGISKIKPLIRPCIEYLKRLILIAIFGV